MKAQLANRGPSPVPEKFEEHQLAEFLELGHKLTGIQLDESKRSMFYARLTRRLRALRLTTFDEYLALLRSGNPEEIEAFTNVVTTNLTYFFREPHHFEYLRDNVVPALIPPGKIAEPIRVWSAGCSSGEEPYSIVMAMLENPSCKPGSFRVLCTDLNTEMIQDTKNGEYREDSVRGLSSERSNMWFGTPANGKIIAKQELRETLICKKLNIFDSWPIRAGVHIIFCRNLLIYFSPEQQIKIVTGFAKLQRAGGYLFLGHSEAVKNIDKYYKRIGNTIFQRSSTKA